ncbi:MAG: hypothetical protein HY692_02955 [Cyanobacteria bacterium NC_groundwater_1444_Ag_S-0.65um_54_12]|nr:hypothetical protein [Cyanobacteria bacterium NC_groundwater_1444_Ag_S-0.65um_54_12]
MSVVSFVVRIWLEGLARPGQQPEWRFQAQHVQSAERIYGRTLHELSAFLAKHAGVSGPLLVDEYEEDTDS